MTVKEIKDYYFRFLKVNLKTKANVSDDYKVTEEDFIKGRIFQKYISGNTLTNIVNGFTVIDHKVYYIYTKIHRIEIITDDFFPPCGGESEIIVNAYYSIRGFSTFKADMLISGNEPLVSPINALISTDNPLFKYEKPYLVNKTPNNTDNNVEVNVTASYYFKGSKYEAFKRVLQHINTYSSWLVEEEPTQFISLTLSENEVPNKGGVVLAKVERCYTKISYKKDSCGNKVTEKSEPGLIEDITNKCLITSSNRKQFNINKNIITVHKQEIGAPQRESTITARYLDKTSSVVLIQKEGGKITYKYDLSFDDGAKVKFADFETSQPVEKKINIISKANKYVDDEYVSSSDTYKLIVNSDCDWVHGVPYYDKETGVGIKVIITEANNDKYKDRESTLTIINKENPNVFIKLIVYQQALDVEKEEYHCVFVSDGEYTYEELNKANLYFHPFKRLIYENGEIEDIKIEDYITFKYLSESGNESMLSIKSIDKNDDGNYSVKLYNFASNSMKDISLTAKLIFYGEYGEKLFESDKANIIAKGTQIIDYNYELCFDGHNKFKNVKWIATSEPKTIKVNSLKHKLIDGIYAGKELMPFKIGIFDENGNEYFDRNFSIKIDNDKIIVFPVNTTENIDNTYVITQKETNDKISFKLSYYLEEQTIKVPLKVLVYSTNIGKDVWTGENGYLMIDNDKKIKLNPCWLSPNMKDNVDTAYNGIIELKEGMHTFETFNVICIEQNLKTYKDCNISVEKNVDETTKEIILHINV